MAKAQTLNFPKGASYMIPFQFRSPGNDVGDWTGWRCYFVVKRELTDPDTQALVNKTIIADPSTGYNELLLTGTETTEYPVGRFYYQATVVDSTGTVGKSEIGAFIVEETTLLSDAGDYEGPDEPVGPPGAGEFTYGATRPIYLDINIVSTTGMSPGIYDPRGIQADVFDVDNHTDGVVNRVYTAIEQSKLAGIAAGATANQTDAYLLARANHTGEQAISTITGLQAALDAKGDETALLAHINDHNNPHQTTKTQVGLPNVDNTADAVKNVLSATKLTTPRNINGVPFDGTANITIADATKEPTIAAGTTSQYWRGDKTWQTLNKAAVGLPNVDNTSDADKPVSTAVLTALNAKANTADVTTALATKEDVANKSTNVELGSSDTLYPTQRAVKTYADNAINTGRILDGRFPVINIDLPQTGDAVNQDPVTRDPKTKDVYIPGTYTITDTNAGIVHSGVLELRGRGNSTWGQVKKPWRIKFDKKTKPLGMTANEKNWGLLAMYFDRSRLGNMFAYELGARMPGLEWTPQIRLVELVLNNTYRGLYELADLVRIEGARVPGPEADEDHITGTWVLEITNKERLTELNGFATVPYNNWIIYDTPDEGLTDDMKLYIKQYIDSLEYTVKSSAANNNLTFTDYLDPYSTADWWLVCELVRNQDSSFWSSVKITKHASDRLRMGPLWDFDASLGMDWSASPFKDDLLNGTIRTGWYTMNSRVWTTDLWTIPAWKSFAAARWQVLKSAITDMGGIESWIDKTVAMMMDGIARDVDKWPNSQDNSTKYMSWSADFRKRWLRARFDWIDAQFASITPTTTPIDDYMAGYASRLYPLDPYRDEY